MQSLVKNIKKKILILSFSLLFPISGFCNFISFLPMEDYMSAARTTPELVNENIKPYRESFYLKNQARSTNYFDFSTSDICAFILLAGIYVMLVKKSSKSRNASF